MPNAIFTALKSIGKAIVGGAENAGMPRLAEDSMGALGRGGGGGGMPSLGSRMPGVRPGSLNVPGEVRRPSGLGGGQRGGMPTIGQGGQASRRANPIPMASDTTRSQPRFGGSAQRGQRANPIPMAPRDGGLGGVGRNPRSGIPSAQRGQKARPMPMAQRLLNSSQGEDLGGVSRNARPDTGSGRKVELSSAGKKMGNKAEDLARRDMLDPDRPLATPTPRKNPKHKHMDWESREDRRRLRIQAGALGASRGIGGPSWGSVGAAPAKIGSAMKSFGGAMKSFGSAIADMSPTIARHGGDTLGVSAIGGAIGGIHGGMTYDPDQERDPLLAQTPVIGRFKAAATGALKGAAYGAAGAAGLKTIQFGAGAAIRNTEAGKFANTDTILGSFGRGFRGMDAPGDLPIAEAAGRGRQTAAEVGYHSYSQAYKSTDVAAAARANVKATGSIKNLQRDIQATKARLPNLKEFGELDEGLQKRVGLTEIPSMIATGIGGALGTISHAKNAAISAYKTHILDPARNPTTKATSASVGRILNPNYEGAASEAAGIKRTLSRDVTAPFVATTAIGAGAIFGVGGAMGATSYGAPAGHPMNAIFKTGDSAITAKAQMEADAAQKIKMQRPTMLGLNDSDEAYFTNPALKPRRESRHTPGKYNDDGSLVFALSNLRRA